MRQVLGPGALGRPRGIGWRERWEGGSGCGTHVTAWLVHVNIWQNPLQCCEVISLQLIKINGKKKKLLASFNDKLTTKKAAKAIGRTGTAENRLRNKEEPLSAVATMELGRQATSVFVMTKKGRVGKARSMADLS